MRPISVSAILAGVLLCHFLALGIECNSASTMPKKETVGSLSKGDVDKFLQLIVNAYKDQSEEDFNQEPSPYNLLKRTKIDDYGHLRFGRSNGQNRFKYTDPDYGHMRFGK